MLDLLNGMALRIQGTQCFYEPSLVLLLIILPYNAKTASSRVLLSGAA